MYDIDPKIANTIKQDTLKNPPDYTNKDIYHILLTHRIWQKIKARKKIFIYNILR